MKYRKTVVMALVLCLAMSMLTACSSGREFSPKGNGMYVSKEGQFSTAFEEAVDKAYFTEADMLKFVETEVIDYNKSKGAPALAYQTEEAGEEVLPVAITSFTYGEKARDLGAFLAKHGFVARTYELPILAEAVRYSIMDLAQYPEFERLIKEWRELNV